MKKGIIEQKSDLINSVFGYSIKKELSYIYSSTASYYSLTQTSKDKKY